MLHRGSTLARMVAAARSKRAAGCAEAAKLAGALREGFDETIRELASEAERNVATPRIVLMVAELDAVIGLVAALDLELDDQAEDGSAAVRRGECIQMELWRDEAVSNAEEGGGFLVTVSRNGKQVRSACHFGALMPLEKLFAGAWASN